MVSPEPLSPDNNRALASYAVRSDNTAGRRFSEAPPAWRNEFQRDRDRVIHSAAFRRLEYKTQVFVNHEGDMFRTRLTHSLEVAQIARTVARALNVNEDLTEAIALAHDLGHTPFGHAGQHALNQCMQTYGGFEHNLHSLRVVEVLEKRYAEFDGLNLLFETREGMLKHCSIDAAHKLGALGQRFIERQQASLEAQIADIADEIAYNHHDIDDGLRSGILSVEVLYNFEPFQRHYKKLTADFSDRNSTRLLYAGIRAMLGEFVNDLIKTSSERIRQSAISQLADVRAHKTILIDFSPAMRHAHLALKRLLHRELYNDEHVNAYAVAARATVSELFEFFLAEPEHLPAQPDDSDLSLARCTADHIAGMTDRFAIAEHQRFVGVDHWPTTP